MIKTEQLYSIRESIPNFVKKLFPKFIRRKINKVFFKYYFLPTNLSELPDLNYPEKGNLEFQKNLVEKFEQKKKQTSFMTCPHLTELLIVKFNSNDKLNFLDIGGEKIDFYLELKEKFPNINYYIFNQKSMIEPFYQLKDELKLNNLIIIDKYENIFDINYDFVNFGSSIQYIQNYEILLKKISHNSKYIFFSGTHLYDSINKNFEKNIIVKQMNILPIINYLYFFNRKNFFNIFEKKNFKLVFESKNLTDNVNYDNFKNFLKNISYSDFLFTNEKFF